MTTWAKADKRAVLLDAAARRFVAAGITRTTMEDIVREAAVGKATLYRYFPNKDAVVDALVERERIRFDRLLREAAAGGADAADGLLRAFVAGLQFLRTHPMLTKSLAEEPDRLLPYLTTRSGPIAETGIGVFGDLVTTGVVDGTLRSDLHIGWTAETLFRLLLSFFTVPPITLPLEDEAAVGSYANGLIRGLTAEQPPFRRTRGREGHDNAPPKE
ncbi:MAG TPA: helix-turn-helix domain-containing protein [Euzebya sp.]|nr:helix-turn-helix domain-containing protein [Euzebya sp.]